MRRAGIFAAVRAKLAPCSVAPPPTITKYCGTARDADAAHAALEADRRDVVLAAAVRAAADLDARAVGRGDEIGPRAQVILEQPARGRATA